MNIYIEKAKMEDINELNNIQKAAFKRLYAIYKDEKSPYLKGVDEMIKWLSLDKILYWKIYYNGRLCGGIAYYKKSEGKYYLARLYIDPQYQGKGIAKQVILLCEREILDAKRYTLDFPIDQIANRKCYESAGYIDTGMREVINSKLTLAIYEKIVGYNNYLYVRQMPKK
ncbi:MAG: GNAT family N-acetyltransferase [Candidatus Niameybacter stercoravium]|nr:GNAT family N-acetyltransferase [Candidatus Niameybacter stercoravium]